LLRDDSQVQSFGAHYDQRVESIPGTKQFERFQSKLEGSSPTVLPGRCAR